MTQRFRKFLFLTDLHYGYERRNGHKIALHDPRAMSIALQFAADFAPDVLILGGDVLDCGAISHHSKGKPGRIEGLRLLTDAADCAREFITPLNQLVATKVYIVGNHERWLLDLAEEIPGLDGLLDLPRLLPLDNWQVVPQGGHYNLGKLTFLHGDQLSSADHIAKNAVLAYERSCRFGHVHTHQVYSKNSPMDSEYPKTGVAVPCLCRKDPNYGKGKPNRWSQGFLWGYVATNGNYFDQVATIINGQAMVNGKLYHAD